jgi:NAD(P)-dependent dehydrogenase (short-subunit alcohol dehydrogenase family)
MRLKAKTAIVTGAAHGIGRAIAEMFAAQGAWVLLADLDEVAGQEVEQAIRKAGGEGAFFRCDVSDAKQAQAAAAKAAARNGKIDVLVNNAAYLAKAWHSAGESAEDEWEKSFRVSLMGAQYFTKETLALMVPQQKGSIINISSIQGLVGGRNSAAYTSMKHGLIGFTRSVAYDYGSKNIRCNVVCPGAITTRISPAPGSEMHQRQISKTFLGRAGEPREVAAATLFLASDDSSYVTGAVLAVDGGWTAM